MSRLGYGYVIDFETFVKNDCDVSLEQYEKYEKIFETLELTFNRRRYIYILFQPLGVYDESIIIKKDDLTFPNAAVKTVRDLFKIEGDPKLIYLHSRAF